MAKNAASANADVEVGAGTGAPQDDTREPDSQESTEHQLSMAYWVMYLFAVLVFLNSLRAFFLPFSSSYIVRTMESIGGMVIGPFLLLNADLLVTYLRLMKEIARFKVNNARFKAGLLRQKQQINKLKKVEKAYETQQKQVGDKMQSMKKQEDEIRIASMDRQGRLFAALFAFVTPSEGMLDVPHLEEIVELVTGIYIRAVPDIEQRFDEFWKGCQADKTFQDKQSMSKAKLQTILKCVLLDKRDTIKEQVMFELDPMKRHKSGTMDFSEGSWEWDYDQHF